VLELSVVTRENLILALISLIIQIPIAVQDYRTRTIPMNSWFRTATIVTLVLAVLGIANRIRLDGGWYNTVITVMIMAVAAIVFFIAWLLHQVGGMDPKYYGGILVPFAFVATPLVALVMIALSSLIQMVIRRVQRKTFASSPVITAVVFGGFLAMALQFAITH